MFLGEKWTSQHAREERHIGRNAMRIYWVNGNERIDIDNGSSIDVIRESGHGRGLTANLLVLPLGINEALGVELMPILAPTQGHLLGY